MHGKALVDRLETPEETVDILKPKSEAKELSSVSESIDRAIGRTDRTLDFLKS